MLFSVIPKFIMAGSVNLDKALCAMIVSRFKLLRLNGRTYAGRTEDLVCAWQKREIVSFLYDYTTHHTYRIIIKKSFSRARTFIRF